MLLVDLHYYTHQLHRCLVTQLAQHSDFRATFLYIFIHFSLRISSFPFHAKRFPSSFNLLINQVNVFAYVIYKFQITILI